MAQSKSSIRQANINKSKRKKASSARHTVVVAGHRSSCWATRVPRQLLSLTAHANRDQYQAALGTATALHMYTRLHGFTPARLAPPAPHRTGSRRRHARIGTPLP